MCTGMHKDKCMVALKACWVSWCGMPRHCMCGGGTALDVHETAEHRCEYRLGRGVALFN